MSWFVASDQFTISFLTNYISEKNASYIGYLRIRRLLFVTCVAVVVTEIYGSIYRPSKKYVGVMADFCESPTINLTSQYSLTFLQFR